MDKKEILNDVINDVISKLNNDIEIMQRNIEYLNNIKSEQMIVDDFKLIEKLNSYNSNSFIREKLNEVKKKVYHKYILAVEDLDYPYSYDYQVFDLEGNEVSYPECIGNLHYSRWSDMLLNDLDCIYGEILCKIENDKYDYRQYIYLNEKVEDLIITKEEYENEFIF